MAPIFEQAATQLEPDVRLIKVDSDAVPELLQRYSIQSIPTLMLVHHGREIARQSGVMPWPSFWHGPANTSTALERDGRRSIPADHLEQSGGPSPFKTLAAHSSVGKVNDQFRLAFPRERLGGELSFLPDGEVPKLLPMLPRTIQSSKLSSGTM